MRIIGLRKVCKIQGSGSVLRCSSFNHEVFGEHDDNKVKGRSFLRDLCVIFFLTQRTQSFSQRAQRHFSQRLPPRPSRGVLRGLCVKLPFFHAGISWCCTPQSIQKSAIQFLLLHHLQTVVPDGGDELEHIPALCGQRIFGTGRNHGIYFPVDIAVGFQFP